MSRAIANIAAEELARRRAALESALGVRKVDRAKALRTERLWLAIACAAGVESEEFIADCIWPVGKRSRVEPFQIEPEADYLAELARARDVAAAKLRETPDDLRLQQRCWDLTGLAVFLGAPPPTSPHLQPSADADAQRKKAA